MNRLALALPLALALAACSPATSGEDDGDVNGDGGSTTDGGFDDGGAADGGASDGGAGDGGQACEVEVDGVSPEDGADGFYWFDEISFTLSDVDSSATITVVDDAGTDIAGTEWWDEDATTLTFAPSAGFTPDSEHTATLSYCAGEEAVQFNTSELGDPVEDESALIGQVYALDLATARWLEPEGVSDFISGGITSFVLVEVLGVGDTLQTMGAVSETSSVDQDVCLPTTDYPDADFTSSPYFLIGPEDVSLDMAGYLVTINEFELSGTFEADGSAIANADIQGQVDIRNLADFIGESLGTTDPDTICGYLVWLGSVCGECASDEKDYCLDVHVDQIDADATGGDVEEIAQADCHRDCEASTTNPDCDTSGW